jgi:hypothetical protein
VLVDGRFVEVHGPRRKGFRVISGRHVQAGLATQSDGPIGVAQQSQDAPGQGGGIADLEDETVSVVLHHLDEAPDPGDNAGCPLA